MKYTWEDFEEIFNVDLKLKPKEAEGLAPEHLAETMVQVYEITVNIPQGKLSTIQHIDIYKNVWLHLTNTYNPSRNIYFIEYCKTGQAHIHGYLEIHFPPQVVVYDDSLLLRMVAKEIFMILPKTYYKQYAKADINPHYRRLKTPAVCLNLKNILSSNWEEYIEKSQNN